MKPQDYVVYRYDCRIYADYKHKTLRYPERNYGTGTTHYQTIHETGWEAVMALVEYCRKEGIECEVPNDEWKEYFTEMDSHLAYMKLKRGELSDSQWKMAFSCDAPNKPGYYRANND